MNEQPTRLRSPLLILALLTSVLCVRAQLQLLPESQPQQVFCGTGRRISLLVSNASAATVTAEVRARLHQASSATTAPVSDMVWKTLQVLPGQTVVESAILDFPGVEAPSRFVLQWLSGTNQILGRSELLVYPRNVLKPLDALVGDKPLGVFDPENQLKPLFKSLGVEIVDLENLDWGAFDGKLAIIGPFASREQMRNGLAKQIEVMAKKGVGVVWIQPPQKPGDPIEPSFYAMPSDRHATVLVQAPLVANLADNPQAQLNLLQFARLALHPEPIRAPHWANEL